MLRDFHFYQKNLSEVFTKKIALIFRRICSIFGKFEKMLNFVIFASYLLRKII